MSHISDIYYFIFYSLISHYHANVIKVLREGRWIYIRAITVSSFFLLSCNSYFRRIVAAGIQPVSGPTSNIASLCVFYNALCWWMCRGISGRSVSGAEVTRCGTYKASVNIVHSASVEAA